ncbi:hypothetical protein BJV82DRAFT_121697 [Fennellomyces sp. T-0311]|nr:hypothetical protein BJV82DRAFT_121697 [Fennellomyces sp. T-0311]
MSDTSDMDISESDEEMTLISTKKEYTAVFESESLAVTQDSVTLVATDRTGAWMQSNTAQQQEQHSRAGDASNWDYQRKQYDMEVMTSSYMTFNGPLVEDLELPYLIDLVHDSDASSREGSETSSEMIEDLYGPFPSTKSGGVAMSPRDSPALNSPRPSDNLVSKQLEIHKLKALIAEREKAKAKKQELERQIVQQNESSTHPLSALPPTTATSAPVTTDSLQTEQSELKRSIDAMSKRIDENSAQLEAAMNMDNGTSDEDSVASDNSDTGDSLISYFTAPLASPDGTPQPASEIDLQIEELQQAIEEHNARLKQLEKARSEAKLKALGLQIRISAMKNRKSKQSTAKAAPTEHTVPNGKGKRSAGYDNQPAVYPRMKVNGYMPPSEPESEPPLCQQDEVIRSPPPPAPSYHSTKRVSDASHYPHTHPIRSQPAPPPPPSTSSHTPAKKVYTPSPPTEHQVHSIADAMKLATYLADVEELIKIRFMSGPKSETVATTAASRRPPRPTRLVTVDDFTLALDSVLLRRNQSSAQKNSEAPSPISPVSPSTFSPLPPYKQETNENSLAFDSLLYNILQRNDRAFHTLSSPVRNALESIISSLPVDVREVQSSNTWGNVSFSESWGLALEAAQAIPDCELLWSLAAEISLYYYGPGDEFAQDIAYIESSAPLAADVLWQKIRASGKEPATIEGVLSNLNKRRAASQNSGRYAKNRSCSNTDPFFVQLKRRHYRPSRLRS